MIMNARIIIVIVVIAVIVIVGAAAWALSRSARPFSRQAPQSNLQNVSQVLSSTNLDPIDPAAVPPGAAIQIGTPRDTVSVNNFYKTALGYDGEAVVIRRTAQYEITYGSDTSAFGIYVMAGPADQARRTAKNDLLGILGITQSELCKLAVTEVISQSADPASSGTPLPVSSCVGSF